MRRRRTYTPKDAGCYVDGGQGIYATDAIVAFARNHGAIITHDEPCDHAETCLPSEFGGCEWADDYEDQAIAYMTERYPVDGHYWGRTESGDWGLWPDED
jgi:hypothetical protein